MYVLDLLVLDDEFLAGPDVNVADGAARSIATLHGVDRLRLVVLEQASAFHLSTPVASGRRSSCDR